MHRSRLGGLIIDCQVAALEESGAFWSRALGLPIAPSDDPEDADYIRLAPAPDELAVEVQRVEHESRVHLDIETDDIPAEVRRLEALGARKVAEIKRWVVMEAPTGHRFCVVPVQRADFEAKATVWPQGPP